MGLLRGFCFCYVRLTKCCSQVIFSFLVTYSARLIFHFCVADLKATRSFQPSLYHCWTKDILSKRKGIYILKGYFLFPLRRQGNDKKKTLFINSNFKLIKYKFCHCLLT